MDIDRKVKIEVLFKNDSIREKTCYCGCIITKLNKDEFTLDKCNNKECSFSHSKFDEHIKELKKQRKEEKFHRRVDKYSKALDLVAWGLLWPILIPVSIYYYIII